jgi:hypothetical protein
MLYGAGVLVPFRTDLRKQPIEVRFFHDSMQSYLTAHALAASQTGQNQALFDAATLPHFTKDRATFLVPDESELFQMCLATFDTRENLRDRLKQVMGSWATQYADGIGRAAIVEAIPAVLGDETIGKLKQQRGAAKVLESTLNACFHADKQADELQRLGKLYARIAQEVLRVSRVEEPAAAL